MFRKLSTHEIISEVYLYNSKGKQAYFDLFAAIRQEYCEIVIRNKQRPNPLLLREGIVLFRGISKEETIRGQLQKGAPIEVDQGFSEQTGGLNVSWWTPDIIYADWYSLGSTSPKRDKQDRHSGVIAANFGSNGINTSIICASLFHVYVTYNGVNPADKNGEIYHSLLLDDKLMSSMYVRPRAFGHNRFYTETDGQESIAVGHTEYVVFEPVRYYLILDSKSQILDRFQSNFFNPSHYGTKNTK